MREDRLKKWAYFTVCAAGLSVVIYLIYRYLLPIFLPFLLALLLAVLLRPICVRFSTRSKMPTKLCAVLFTFIALGLLGFLCYLLCSALLSELQNFLLFLSQDSENPSGKMAAVFAFFRHLAKKMPFAGFAELSFLKGLIGDPEVFFGEQFRAFTAKLLAAIPDMAISLLRSMPSFVFSLIIGVIACFFFSVEYETVIGALTRMLPSGIQSRVPEMKEKTWKACRRYLRAYLLLFLLTLGELMIGFLLLRVNYAFLLALFTAVLDILPVLGVGTVLIPFAVFSLITGNPFLGVGLLLLYAVITVVRQIAEPHLVGKSLGLHPILVLVSFYAGIRLLGFPGIFIGPGVAVLIKSLISGKKEAD